MSTSETLFDRAVRVMPGGVNSPVRAFKAVGGNPVFIQKGEGSRIWDVDGQSYIDYIGSWGPLINGHRSRPVTERLHTVVDEMGTSFGAPTEMEVELAEEICGMYPSIDTVRLVNSGTEATMSAIRLARGFTGRDRILKFEGCYHGHGDSLLVKAGSGVLTLGLPDSPGVPHVLAELTQVAGFNDLGGLKDVFGRMGDEIACVIVEPVAGNMGCVAPASGFLELLRELTTASGTILIFDEVMTGFRLSPGGAQDLYGIRPDLTALGKIIGGGLPVGAYGGRADIMGRVAPSGPIYQAGTLSGNPLAVAAGLETLRGLQSGNSYEKLEALGSRLETGIKNQAAKRGAPFQVNRVGSMLTLFFTEGTVSDFPSAKTSDTGRFEKFFGKMLNNGIYWPPSQFESAFISTAHSEADIDETIAAIGRSL